LKVGTVRLAPTRVQSSVAGTEPGRGTESCCRRCKAG